MKYRLYIDEVGNPDFGSSETANHRYLSLTGIILELDYAANAAKPRVEDLKKQFFKGPHPDDPVLLLLRELDYLVLTVVIDKLEQKQRYWVWRFDPYHYVLKVLTERWKESRDVVTSWQKAGAEGKIAV